MKIAKILSAFALTAIVACSSGGGNDNNGNSSSSNGGGPSDPSSLWTGWPFDNSGENLPATPALSALGLENVIKIEYKNGESPVIENPDQSDVTILPTGENVVVSVYKETSKKYNIVLSGTAKNGSLKIYNGKEMGLYLNGVNITNSNGPAINNQGKKLNVHLVNGTENVLTDGTPYGPPTMTNGVAEDAKGTFFSEKTLSFGGSGSLEIRSKERHAIVTDENIEIKNGKIIISESANDGIHANERIDIEGGVIKISCQGDAIQNEKEGVYPIKITGGKIAVQTFGDKSHGIASVGPTSISDSTDIATIQIRVSGKGSKGINSTGWLEFVGGKTSIQTTGTRAIAGTDTTNTSGIKVDSDLFIEGGELTIKSTGDKAKGISVDGNIFMTSGKIDIEANDDGIKVDRNLSVTGGSGSVKSTKKKAIDCKGTCDKGSLSTTDASL